MTDSVTTFSRTLLLSLTMTLCLGVAAVQARVIEKVAAVVNGEVITQTELDKAAGDTLSELRQNTSESRLDEKLQAARQRILDEMIEDLLIKQKAEELQISVSEED
ncbi:MAG: SurA N-terminal domain-containing protein, partial [Desulfurivibrionaceae bacterium]